MGNMRKNAYFINIKDLLVECVRKAPIIVLVAVICTILFVASSVFLGNEEEGKLSKEELEAVLSEEEMEVAENYLKASENYEKYKEDLEKSAFMKFSTDEAMVGSLNYLIECENELDVETISIMITNYVKRTDFYNDLNVEIDDILFREYISLYGTGKNSQIVCINVYHDDIEMCKKLVNAVDVTVTKYANQIAQGKGKISKFSESYQKDIEYIGFIQRDAKNKLSQLNQEKAAIAATLNINQIEYIDIIQGDQQAEATETTGISLKTVLLGLIVGIAAGAVAVVAWYLFNNKIKYSEEVEAMCGINYLGTIVDTEKINWSSKVNRFFYKEYKNDSLSLIVARIVALLGKDETKDVTIITDIDDELMIKSLSLELTNRNLKVNAWENLYNNEQALSDLCFAKNALFVVKLRKNNYMTLQKEISYCNKQGINIIGYVVKM